MFDSVQNNTWLFFRLLLFEFLFFMNHLSRCFTHKRISRICICSLKNFACFILFSYQCSFAVLICFVCDSFVIISCVAFFVNNFFQLFLILFSLFQRRLLKLISVLLICCCRVQQPWLIYTPVQQKSTIFFKIFSKRHFNQHTQFFALFLCTLYSFI